MAIQKQVTELDALPSFTDTSIVPVHNGAGLKKGTLTQLTDYMGTKFSNPNLLINPDFKINQREGATYEKQGFSVDRWRIWNCTAKANANGTITLANDKYDDNGTFIQALENQVEGASTVSCYIESVSGKVNVFGNGTVVQLKQGFNEFHTNDNLDTVSFQIYQGASVVIRWVKLEQGSVATPFVAPNPAEELVKCQRYFEYINESIAIPIIYNTNNAANNQKYYMVVDRTFKLKKRTTPTVSIGEITDSGDSKINVNNEVVCNINGIANITFSDTLNKFSLKLKKINVDAEIY